MQVTEENVTKLKRVLSLMDEDSITHEDFLKAFAQVVALVKKLQQTNTNEFNGIHKAFQVLSKRINDEKDTQVAYLSQQIKDTLQSQIKAVNDKLKTIKPALPGKDADENVVVSKVLEQLPPYPVVPPEKIGEDFRNALEALQGDDRLDASAIKNLPEISKQDNSIKGVLTASALYSLADVDVAGIVVGQSILWTGQRWIPFTPATGSGGYQQPTSGIVNGINTIFVFTTAPNALSVDGGRAIQKVSSDGTVNWTGTTTITLSVAPNSDIFAVA